MKPGSIFDSLSRKEKIVYREVSHKFEITVRPEYISEQSSPDQDYYFFAYHVKITNRSEYPAQLVYRHWIITDGYGNVEEVMGDGVVGEQPVIEVNGEYSYSSFCPLSTPTGNMRGSYNMRTPDGQIFQVKIPLFFLRHPRTFQ